MLIRQAPARYLWSYNRYKTPAGVALPDPRFAMTRFCLAVLWLLHWLPVPVLAVLARVLGRLGYVLARERRRVG